MTWGFNSSDPSTALERLTHPPHFPSFVTLVSGPMIGSISTIHPILNAVTSLRHLALGLVGPLTPASLQLFSPAMALTFLSMRSCRTLLLDP